MSDTAFRRGPGVAVTRPGPDPGRLGELLRAAGATVEHWPCIRFASPIDPRPLEVAIRSLESYDWVVVASPRAAMCWAAACRDRGVAPAGSGGPAVRCAAVGPATAEALREAGWPVARRAASYSAAGLIEAFAAAGDARGARVLVPSSDLADDVLPLGLRGLGADVERVTAYRTVPTAPDRAAVGAAAATGAVCVVTFTSPSTVEGFLAVARDDEPLGSAIRRRFVSAAIGPTTARALSDAAWAGVMAEEATLEALAAAAMAAARDETRSREREEAT